MKKTNTRNLWDTAKTMLKKKLTVLNVYVRKKKGLKSIP